MSNNRNWYLVIWEFHVKPEARIAFEKIYGADGDWARLFRQSRDYRGTQLLRDIDRPGRYLTVDRWISQEALRQFKLAHQADYDAIDKRCDDLTNDEFPIGEFAELDSRA